LHERRGMDHALHDLLIQQDNIVSRLQALEYMSLDAIRHNLRGKWRILLPGIYLAATGAPAPRQRLRAALLYGGSSAQLADSTALLAYGVRYLPQDATIRLLLPAAARRVNRDGVEVRRTHRLPAPRTIHGLPYCPPERALVEFAARVGDKRVATAVIADAVQRRIASPTSRMPRSFTSPVAAPGLPDWRSRTSLPARAPPLKLTSSRSAGGPRFCQARSSTRSSDCRVGARSARTRSGSTPALCMRPTGGHHTPTRIRSRTCSRGTTP
jgi:hypothetical protein